MATPTPSALEEPRMKLKLCLVGDGHVGKTSLIRRFVDDEFQDRYVATLGTRVTKKELQVRIPHSRKRDRVVLMIWDIMGHETFHDLFQEGWFDGVQGSLMVCDVSRPDTLSQLEVWRESVESVAGKVPSYILANKVDLEGEASLDSTDLAALSKEWGCPYLFTSARTGEGVEKAFKELTLRILD